MTDARAVAAEPTALVSVRLEALLAEVSGAASFAAAAQVLAQAFASAVASPAVLVYALREGDATVRRVAGFGNDASDRTADRASPSFAEAHHPVVLATLSLYPIGCEAGEPLGMPAGAWLVIPLPQPMATWSPQPIDAPEVATRSVRPGCRIVTLQPGERRRRVGLAPFGAVAVQLPRDAEAPLDDAYARVLSALLPAATLGGPILARSQAVERYREAAERLDRQRDLLSEIIDSLPDPVVLVAPPGHARSIRQLAAHASVLAENRRAAALLDIVHAEGEARLTVLHANDAEFARVVGERLWEGGAFAASELTLRHPDDGSELRFEVQDHPLGALAGADDGDSGGKARLVVLRDVTALRRAAGALEQQVQRARLAERDARRERDRLDLLLDYVADPILMTNANADVLEANRQAERLFPAAAALGPAMWSAEQPTAAALERMRENFDAFRTFLTDFAASGESSRRGRLNLRHPLSGNALPVEVVSGTVRGTENGQRMIVSVVHDLTTQVENERLYEELKRFSEVLEARVRAATAHLAEQNAQLQWQSRELEKANRLKSEFLANMSHELRTPINALIGYTALMLDRVYGELTAKQEEGLRRAQGAAQHLLALINDILDLAKIEAGRMPMHIERVAVADAVREVSVQIEPLARGKRLDFVTAVPGELPALETDPTKLRQILLNLVSNAIKFTSSGSVTLSASVAAAGARVRFEVTDTGPGIREEDLGVIWDDFRQLDQSRTREFGGTGLGLSIVRKLADRLGATVGVRSEVGVGSTFWVEVPTAEVRGSDPGTRDG